MKLKIKKNLIWTLIPAKGNSKRVKKKNLKKINELSLVCFSVIISKMNSKIQKTFVSTDNKQIKKISEKYGAIVPFLRPKKFSTYGSEDFQYIDHFINFISKNESILPEFIIQLRPTAPFRSNTVINKAIEKIKKNPTADSLRSSHIASHPPEKQFRVKKNFYVDVNLKKIKDNSFNKPSHFFKETYEPNGYVDILKTSHLIKNKKNVYGKNILFYLTEKIIDIDTLEDFEFARSYNSPEKKKILKEYKK